jgi:methylenetetrahydrofolate dehydrogenase (NADP+)/methenyltetrahydrofolate cyclohydrolase
MKLLNGSELAGYIKERQAKTVRGLVQGADVHPKLAIIQCNDDPVINTYVRLKKRYGEEINIPVDHYMVDQSEVKGLLTRLNSDDSVSGIILQLPLSDTTQTDELCSLVAPEKDVDALGPDATMQPATPMAILWLLAGYNVDFAGKKILIVGNGKLVGNPLSRDLIASGYDVTVADKNTLDLKAECLLADIVISATGQAGLIKPDMLKHGAVAVDAGVASEEGKITGDFDDSVYERDDLTLSPRRGGVGPLTICALFENVIKSASKI